MRLKRARIQTFRSIVDSGYVDIDDRLTVIVGKNEQGKTTFLKALASFDSKYRYNPKDLPNHLGTQLEERAGGEIPIVTLSFAPDQSDAQQLEALIPGIKGITEFEVTKYYDGHYNYQKKVGDKTSPLEFAPPDISAQEKIIKTQLEAIREKYSSHLTRLPALAEQQATISSHIDSFAKSTFNDVSQIDNLFKTFVTGLSSISGQDATIQQEVEPYIKEIQGTCDALKTILSKDRQYQFADLLPHFIFHSTVLDKIPNSVNLTAFLADPQTTSRPMANLCMAAGLPMQKIKSIAENKDTASRIRDEEHYNGRISGGINDCWTQASYEIHFRFDPDKLSIFISDEKYDRSISPEERSDGFQWYLSFYSTIWKSVGEGDATILLLDNPGLELHSDGQRDIKKFLEEKLPASCQIVYVTHSPAMIDAFNLSQVRQVERDSKDGTKIAQLRVKSGDEFDLLEPVRTAIGSSLATSLMFGRFNVLVEGAADKPILDAGIGLFLKEDKDKILINGSIAETKDAVLPKFYMRANLPLCIYLDADDSGRRLHKTLKEAGIPDEKFVNLKNLFKDASFAERDFEMEDILSADLYYQAVTETYPKIGAVKQETKKQKRSKQYEEWFREHAKIEFAKRNVAETVKRLLTQGKGDKESLDNLQILVNAVHKNLTAQLANKTGQPEEADQGIKTVVTEVPSASV